MEAARGMVTMAPDEGFSHHGIVNIRAGSSRNL
jgi:hypothetical protein